MPSIEPISPRLPQQGARKSRRRRARLGRDVVWGRFPDGMSIYDMPNVMSNVEKQHGAGACLMAVGLALLVAAPAEGGGGKSTACVGREFSYAGLQSNVKAHGVSATIAPAAAPSVSDGHVGGWISVGGTDAGPGGVAEWIQVGLAAFTSDQASRMYYEFTAAGEPHYVELAASVTRGEHHRFFVLETASRKAWWRVWVDGRPVSPPINLPGSHGASYPQAIAENWNGGTGTCNDYAYSFS